MRFWPRNLFGKMLLLMAAALLVAQAINVTMLLAEVRSRRANFVAGGAVARATDVVQRIEHGLDMPRGLPAGPDKLEVTIGELASGGNLSRDASVEQRLADALRESSTPFRAVRVFRVDNEDRDALIVAVQMPDARWVNLKSLLPPGESSLILRLLFQTAIIFAALFIAVSLIGRHVTRPLRNLKKAAASFGTVNSQDEVPVEGPSDVQQLITTFNQMAARLRQMLEEKDQMLGAIGHDLRTPLASLRLRVEGLDDESERLKTIDTIDEMGRTLEDILALARIGRAGDDAAESVDLGALIDALVQDLQDLDQPVHLASADRMVAHVRPAALRRAVRNLIENAVAYGREADVTLRRKGNKAIMVIRDFGPGIPEADLERVFDGFVRLESSRSRATGGSGLGLTLARGIIQDLGGSLTLENAKPGLRATIALPLAG